MNNMANKKNSSMAKADPEPARRARAPLFINFMGVFFGCYLEILTS